LKLHSNRDFKIVFFQRNILVINKVSPLDVLLHTTELCWIENSRAAILSYRATNGPLS